MLRCGIGVRRAAHGSRSMEEALGRVVRFLCDELRNPDGSRSCAMVRAYKTHAYGQLDSELQRFARRQMGGAAPDPGMKCLTLMASVGDRPEWNDRRASAGHQAIPLPRPDVVRDLEGRTYGVFFEEDAVGSPYIPAQREFVEPNGIRSVLGCDGALRGGDLFAVILFSRVPISPDAADRFRTIALDMKSSLFFFDEEQVFSGAS